MRLIGSIRVLLLALLATATAGSVYPAFAQGDAGYPSKPIRLIVGFGAGGGNDLFARLVGQKLSENIGQPVIIENKPGAGGRLAVEYVASQPADGYTLVVGASGQMAIASAIYPKLSYHPTKTFTPITMIASFPLILAGPMNDTIKSVKDLVAYGKANPDKSNYATSSPAFTITTELFKLKTGMPAQPIPYKSSNEMMLSIAGKQTLFAIADGPPTVPLVKGGKVRALAVTGAVRSSELPDVPSMAEVGLPEVNIGLWSGIFTLGQHAACDRQEARGGVAPRARGCRRARQAQGDGGQSGRRVGRGIREADQRRHQGLRRGGQGREPEV